MVHFSRLIRSSLIGLWLALAGLQALPSYAADPWRIDDLAVLADPTGQESITSVSQSARAAEFRPAPHGFSAGYTRSVHWLRFTLHAPPLNAAAKREMLLEIHPAYLDDLQIHVSQPDKAGQFDTRTGGDLQPHSDKEYPYRAFVYQIDFDDARSRTVYVRLHTTSSSVLTLKAWEPRQFFSLALKEYALLGVLFGLIVAGVMANVWHGLWQREAIYRRYIVYLLATLVMLFGINGLAGAFLFPHKPLWAHYWVSLSTVFVILVGTHFYILALEINRAALWMRWIYRAQLWFAILCLPSPFFDLYPEAIRLLMPYAILMLLTGAWRSVQLWREHNANGKILLLAHLFGLAGALASVLTMLGLLPGQFSLIYAYQMGTAGTLLTLQLMLAQHVRAIKAKQVQATMEIEIAKATAQQERAEREHQRHFLSMLTHELKTPLSVIRLRLGAAQPTERMQAHAKQAVLDIDAIVERCAMVSQMDDKTNERQSAVCKIDEILREILAQPAYEERVTLQISAEVLTLRMHSDPLLLRTICSNLLDNAIKYSPPEAAIQVSVVLSAAAERRGIFLSIENPEGDAGPPDPARIFEKYYRAPGAHQKSGSGLGLYIVKALVEQLGGNIVYRPQIDRVVFEICLPL